MQLAGAAAATPEPAETPAPKHVSTAASNALQQLLQFFSGTASALSVCCASTAHVAAAAPAAEPAAHVKTMLAISHAFQFELSAFDPHLGHLGTPAFCFSA